MYEQPKLDDGSSGSLEEGHAGNGSDLGETYVVGSSTGEQGRGLFQDQRAGSAST